MLSPFAEKPQDRLISLNLWKIKSALISREECRHVIDEFDVDFSNKIAPQNRTMTFSCFKSVLFFPLSSDYIY